MGERSSTPRTPAAGARAFFGARVVRGAFVLALFGWGLGFYGPPVYLHAVMQRTGWPLAFVSAVVTVHYLCGAALIAGLPRLHARFGVGPTAVVGACAASLGVYGWAVCEQRWQLLAAALLSGGGWVTMGAVALNAAVSPWFVRKRPVALASAYNGASVGGIVFAPLWAGLIGGFGFAAAALSVGAVTVIVVAVLAATVFAATPQSLGQRPDGDAADASGPAGASGTVASAPPPAPLPGASLWRDRGFRTLAAGMAIGLFAQIGLLAHLYTLLVPVLGPQAAGWAMGLATACAIAGRYAVAWTMPPHANRRTVAALAYGVQALGTVLLLLAGEQQIAPILLAVALFGSGIGNATSLPPLIAQAEFAPADVPRVVALIVALAQATYAFAPGLLGALLAASGGSGARIGQGSGALLAAVLVAQLAALGCYLVGGRRG